MQYEMHPKLRRRILMFYFAAGINIVMAMYVVSVGSGQIAGGTLGVIAVVFLAFAYVNFYFAKRLKRQWEEEVRRRLNPGEEAKK